MMFRRCAILALTLALAGFALGSSLERPGRFPNRAMAADGYSMTSKSGVVLPCGANGHACGPIFVAKIK